jgi:AAA15 family ATPase/GTPase
VIIESIRVQNFRSVLDETLLCANLTALVGANGSGKSTFLKALELFYSTAPSIDVEDFYNRDTSNEIVFAVTFKGLSKEATDLFAA